MFVDFYEFLSSVGVMSNHQLDDILDLVYPRLDPAAADEPGFDEAVAANEAERERYAAALEGIAEAVDSDVLLAALADATHRANIARDDQRRLLAYARAFWPGAPYPRQILAEACGGRTEGWVRATVTDDDVAAVARLLDTTPLRKA